MSFLWQRLCSQTPFLSVQFVKRLTTKQSLSAHGYKTGETRTKDHSNAYTNCVHLEGFLLPGDWQCSFGPVLSGLVPGQCNSAILKAVVNCWHRMLSNSKFMCHGHRKSNWKRELHRSLVLPVFKNSIYRFSSKLKFRKLEVKFARMGGRTRPIHIIIASYSGHRASYFCFVGLPLKRPKEEVCFFFFSLTFPL